MAGGAGSTIGQPMDDDYAPEIDNDSLPMDDDYHPEEIDNDGLTEDQIARRDAMLNESEMAGHGTYKVHSTSGAELEFDLPTDPDNDALTQITQYMEDVNADTDITFIVADVDNRNGQDLVELSGIDVFDEEGNQYEFTSISEHLNDISPSTDWDGDDDMYLLADGSSVPGDVGHELYNRGVDLHNEYLHGIDVAGRGEIILVYEDDDLPEQFTRVATWPLSFGESEDAYLAD